MSLYQKTLLASGVTAIIYVLFFLFLDKEIDVWVHANISHTWVAEAGTIVSMLANGSYVKLTLSVTFIVIFISDPCITKTTTKNILFICLSLTVAIIVGGGIKYLLARYRPVMFFDEQLYGLHFLSSKWEMNSTPSGHTYRAFAFFTALALLFKRYAVPFICSALLIGISRVVVTAHYPSDVLFGAFIGIVAASWLYRVFLHRDVWFLDAKSNQYKKK